MSKTPAHVHQMEPIPVMTTTATIIYHCNSCAFVCTKRALPLVEKMKNKHVRVKAGSPQSLVPWDGEVAGR